MSNSTEATGIEEVDILGVNTKERNKVYITTLTSILGLFTSLSLFLME